jgi:tetratricopeptide (TPR) repeat protein
LKTRDPADEKAASQDAYDEVIDRVFAHAVSQEQGIQQDRALAQDLYAELMLHPVPRRNLLVRNSGRFRSRTFCELLLQESHEAGFQDPSQSGELARLAVTVAELLSPEDCGGAEAWNGLCARAWAQLGNAGRIGSDLLAAEQAFAEARARSQQGISLLDAARVLDLEASLHRDRRRLEEASRLLDQVIRIYQRLGQWNLLGRALKQRSMVCGEEGDLESEMAFLRRALDLLDPREEPRTFLAARHNLISALNQSGRSREAFSLLFHTRPLYLKIGGRMNLLRMRWLEGLVAQGLGREEQAATAFREVREAFLDLGLGYDAALVSLDLAGILVHQGRAADVRRLAEDMLAALPGRDLPQEATAALLCFCHTARQEDVGTALVQRIADFLKRARYDPALRFAKEDG